MAPESEAKMVLPNVLTRDVSGSREPYLFSRVVVGYTDLARRQYHSVVRLTDPGHGQREGWERDANARRDTDPGNEPHQRLETTGTEVGEGAAPPQQWRVTFAGRELGEESKARLRADAILYFGRHGLPGGNWSFTVFVSAERAAEAIERVQDALGSDAGFVGFAAEPWRAHPFTLRPQSRVQRLRSCAASLARRVPR